MVDTISKETQCVLCKETYSPVIEPEEDQTAYKLSCSSCTECYSIGRGVTFGGGHKKGHRYC